jgi:hypothetical protein
MTTKYPSFDEIKEVTEVDLEELYPSSDFSEEDMLQIFKDFLEYQHEPSIDNGIYAYHQVIFYCVNNDYMRLGKLLYLAMKEPTNAFVHYAIEKDRLLPLLFLLDNKLYDVDSVSKDMIDKISSFVGRFVQ